MLDNEWKSAPARQPKAVNRRSNVLVSRFAPEWDDLPWSTLRNLGVDKVSLGTDLAILRLAKFLLARPEVLANTFYANPAFLIKPAGTFELPCFIRQARVAQHAFWRQARDVLGRPWRIQMRSTDGLLRQLAFNGILFVDGRHIHPQRWPDNPHMANLGRHKEPIAARKWACELSGSGIQETGPYEKSGSTMPTLETCTQPAEFAGARREHPR